jgi:triacylglycerol lipase
VNPLFLAYRRTLQQLRYLSGYLAWDVDGNRIQRRTDFTQCNKPVLLLYGFFSTRRTFEVLERRLRRDGYGVFSLNLGGLAHTFNTKGIDDLADFVRAKVERFYGHFPQMGPLTIIGHSKGGIIGSYYVKKLGGHRRVRTLITLGTPHHGTSVAYLGLPFSPFARSIAQMTPMSPFIRRLQKGPWPDGVHLISLYSKLDRMAPYPAPLLDVTTHPLFRNIEVVCSHREFLYKKRIYDLIVNEIRSIEAQEPAKAPPLSLVAETNG